MKFPEYKKLDLPQINEEILKFWEQNNIFDKSISSRDGQPAFIFFEGPPSANGRPGIHHVLARTIKDIICRYKTLQGFQVKRKAGWDTHGLPVELGVETALGITKEDIGKKISVADYNKQCREDVMKFTDVWEELTSIMGYWINMDDPYITYDNRYIETVWYLLKELYNKKLLYKGFSIQPYSPAAGTGLSTHELNQPGCYREVKDTTVVAQFRVKKNEKSDFLFNKGMQPLDEADIYLLAWTTTPWTLLSNTALAVGKNITYYRVQTFNPYSGKSIVIVIAKDRFRDYFPEKNEGYPLDEYTPGDKNIPYKILAEYQGVDLQDVEYEQLLPYKQPTDGNAFKVLVGDFVTTDEGTGIVHIAPSFGADDFRLARQYGIGSLTLVDKHGRFVEETGEFSGRYVKNEFDDQLTDKDPTVDVEIAVKLKKENKAFRIAKYSHSYPHCWRTDKPVLYYPLDSWFIRTTKVKEQMIALNNTINWKPRSTGTGRFGKWLENLVDWNLSRSRYWGTPLPIWITEDRQEEKCIGSVAELKQEVEKAVEAGFMESNPLSDFSENDFSEKNYSIFDLHRPFVDEITLVSPSGRKMYREADLIDVWFDSGAMPYAQLHYPFEHNDDFKQQFPAHFIAEGVDQTRGWFFTLHAIAVMLFDSVAFKNIISNGLVLDKNGAKMSKRLKNHIDPFDVIRKYGADPTRWYMVTNAQPWDNLKFDCEGVAEVQRKFFGTLYNTYSFFALYANVDGFNYSEPEIPTDRRPEIDKWIISLLNTLVKEVEEFYEEYEPTKAGRVIQHFVIENLSNWYVRLNRKRFWGGEYNDNKIAAYQTLYQCLSTIAALASPIAPFYSEKLFNDLNKVTKLKNETSVHLIEFPQFNEAFIDKSLEERMDIAQRISSMTLGLRRKANLKVRQPLQKIMVPVLNENFVNQIKAVEDVILSEINVKELQTIDDTAEILIKRIKPDFKKLGPRFGKKVKTIAKALKEFNQDEINQLEKQGSYMLSLDGDDIELTTEDVEIISEDIPGWLVASDGKITVALDITVTRELRQEGIARELINRIQNMRKDFGLEITDKIHIDIEKHEATNSAVSNHKKYIGEQTLALSINLVDTIKVAGKSEVKDVELDDNITLQIQIVKAENPK